MVKVPTYEQDVSTRPIFRQDIDVRATPSAFGADVGRGMQSLAQGVNNVGDAMAALKELEDVNSAKEADNGFADWSRERMYGDGGFMTLEGRNAVQGRKDFEREAEEKRKEFGKNLTPGAQQAYQKASKERTRSLYQQAITHSVNQQKAWFKDASNARIETFGNDALANYNNPALVTKNLAAGVAELREQGHMAGWDADTLKLRESQYITGVQKNIVLRLAQDDPLAAEKYLNERGAGMNEVDKVNLRNSLEAPILAAKAERNLAGIVVGVPSQDYSSKPSSSAGGDLPPVAASAGPMKFNDVASKLIGLNENGDNQIIASFIKRSAGIDIDPKVTPWCAAFVNGVLGAAGVEGTGKLNARSFLNFGQSVETPRMGDVVVLSRGTGGQGHVGFFQGFDAQGNVVVLGGNQGNKVSVATYSADKVLGYRRAGAVNENTAKLPNYGPQGLASIDEQLSKIKDPKEREATQKALSAYYTAQKKAMDAQKEHLQTWAETQVIKDPTFDPMKMPVEAQAAIGASGMTALLNYTEKVRTAGQPVTDERLLYDMRTMYATDPVGFAEIDIFKYRDKLDNAAWKEVSGWRQTALTDQRKAKEDGLNLSTAFDQAKSQLEAVGITTTGKDGSEREAEAKRIAQFQNALAAEMEAFKRANENRAPTQVDIQSMVNKLLLPVVMSKPVERSFFDPLKVPGDQYKAVETDAFLFEARSRPDGTSFDVRVEYEDIPFDVRRGIAADLEQDLGRKPSEAEVVVRYEDYKLGRDPTVIPSSPPQKPYEASGPDNVIRPIVAPLTIPLYYGSKLLGIDLAPAEDDAPKEGQ